jgi:outer membrane protein assembly factor BamE (lipoprotein component of BamABCDE complex)
MSLTSKSPTSLSRRTGLWLGLAFTASLVAGCQPTISRRGYYAKPGTLAQIAEGMPKSEVEAILGSPSTTASINLQGDSYFYISSVTQGRAFLTPVETNREVIVIRFDQSEQVTSVAQYGLEDGRVINIHSRETPVAGEEFSLINELLKRRGGASGGNDINLKRRIGQ